MMSAVTIRAPTIPSLIREQTRWFATIVFSANGLLTAHRTAFQVKAGVRGKALQKQKRRINNIASTGRPAAAKGGSVPPLR
jgi:hypothetical protein